jgi:acetyl esterase/lipase
MPISRPVRVLVALVCLALSSRSCGRDGEAGSSDAEDSPTTEDGAHKEERHVYPPITPASTFGDVFEHPAFAGFSRYVAPSESAENMRLISGGSIESLVPLFGPMDPQTVTDGYNFLIDHVNAGETVFHPLYADDEAASDPTKATAGMFFVAGDPGRALAVIAPGGAFIAVASVQEGFPYARALNELGYHVAILKYRVDPDAQPGGDSAERGHRAQMASEDMDAAMSLLEDHADEWGVSLDDYSVWGSSAGGIVVSNWASNGPLGAEEHGFSPPSVVINVYTPPAFDTSSPFPPYFAATAADDELVPVTGIDAVVDELEAAGVEVEYHRFDTGGHGFGLGVGTPAHGWLDDAVAFWQAHMTV